VDSLVGAGGQREIYSNYSWIRNRTVKWVGPSGRIIFTQIRELIYASTNDGSSFSLNENTGGDSTTNSIASGFVMVTGSNNQPYLVCSNRQTGGATQTWVNRWDGTSWVNDSISLPGASFSTQNAELFAAFSLVFVRAIGTTSADGGTYDPVTRGYTTRVFPWSIPSGQRGVHFTLNKRLFYAVRVSSGLSIAEFVLGGWVSLGNPFVSYINSSGNRSQTPAAVKLGDNSVLLFGSGNNGGGDGLEAAHMQIAGGALTQNRVTNDVVPAFLRAGTSVGDPTRYDLLSYADNAQTPGSPIHYLWFAPDGNTVASSVALLKVNDESSLLEVVGTTQFNRDYSPPSNAYGGGHLTLTPGELSIQTVDQTPDSQGLRILYRCAGDPGNPDKTASFRFVDSFGVPVGICTLVAGSAVGGGTVVGNTVTGVDADPSIVHEVVWDFITDGVQNGSYLHDQAFLTS
jgi:hypothetical protein